jgi:hypothetical protein
VIQRVAPIILVVATFVWAISIVADIALTDYRPDPFVHSIMLGVIGIIGALYGIKRRNGNDRNGR